MPKLPVLVRETFFVITRADNRWSYGK